MSRMPVVFFGHGNPLNALDDNAYTRAWRGIGESLPRPRAIVCVSAHWYLPGTFVTASAQPRTIHDFGGFPRALYEVQYRAPGDAALAGRLLELVPSSAPDTRWGFDHGSWSVFCHVYPDADIPLVQLSIDETLPPHAHYELGQCLRPLRDEGVLITGSGNLVHNLHALAWGNPSAEPFDWARRFEAEARGCLTSRTFEPLIDYERNADARLAAPTPDHYLPLLYCMGASDERDTVSFPVEGIDGGSISMLSVMFA